MILWKEWRETLPLMVLSAAAICGVSYVKWEGWRIEFFEFQFWFVAALYLVLFIPFLGAAAIAGERENDTFDALLARPVGLSTIFFTKYFVRLAEIILLLLALIALFLLLRPTHNLSLYDVARATTMLTSFLAFALTVSFLASCFADTSPKAYVAGVALLYISLFILNGTRFFKYTWWWRDSFEDMWLEYVVFYAILSLVALAAGGILFTTRTAFTCSWKYLTIVGVLIFLTFIRSASTLGWLVAGLATSGDIDLVRLIREPLPEMLENTSKVDTDKVELLRQFLISSRDPLLEPRLIEELKNPNPKIRNEAVRILTDREAKQAQEAMIPLLQDPDDEVRHSAISFVHIYKCERAAPEVIKLLDDPNSSIRQRAVYALAAVKEKDAGPHLMRALKDKNPRVHSAAAHQLCQLDYTEAQEEIVLMMQESPIKHTRQNAAAYLGLMKSAPACDELIGMLSSEDERIVNNAVYSLGNLGCEDSLELLLKMQDENATDTLKMIVTLGNIGGPGAVETLKKMFAGPEADPKNRIEIALVLAELGDASGVPFLRDILEKELHNITPDRRNWAAYTVTRLARAGEYAAVPGLINLTDGRWPQDNYRYGKMLEELTGKKYGWDSDKWRKWWEKNKDELLQEMLAGNVHKGGS